MRVDLRHPIKVHVVPPRLPDKACTPRSGAGSGAAARRRTCSGSGPRAAPPRGPSLLSPPPAAAREGSSPSTTNALAQRHDVVQVLAAGAVLAARLAALEARRTRRAPRAARGARLPAAAIAARVDVGQPSGPSPVTDGPRLEGPELALSRTAGVDNASGLRILCWC